jgi:hypothetical protein
MSAVIQISEETQLPFVEAEPQREALGKRGEFRRQWFLSLRHARIPFRADDRLILLYGHPLVFRLGLHAAAERVLAGEPVLYLDGANTFDPLVVGRLARAYRRQPRAVLSMIHVARAYSDHQLERLISDCLMFALDRYQSRIAILSGVFDTHYDQAVPEQDEMRFFGRIMEASQRLAQQGHTLLFLCPQLPSLTRTAQRGFDRLRLQANRVIRVHEEHGLVKLQEEGDVVDQSWQIARTALETR